MLKIELTETDDPYEVVEDVAHVIAKHTDLTIDIVLARALALYIDTHKPFTQNGVNLMLARHVLKSVNE